MRPSQRRAARVVVADCRAAVEQSSEFRKRLHGMSCPGQMQRAAICCEQMRFSRAARFASVVARAAFELRQSTAADPGIPRTDDHDKCDE